MIMPLFPSSSSAKYHRELAGLGKLACAGFDARPIARNLIGALLSGMMWIERPWRKGLALHFGNRYEIYSNSQIDFVTDLFSRRRLVHLRMPDGG